MNICLRNANEGKGIFRFLMHGRRAFPHWNILIRMRRCCKCYESGASWRRRPSYLWLYRISRMGPPIVIFDYRPIQGGDCSIRAVASCVTGA